MGKLGSISLSLFLFFMLIVPGCRAQSTGSATLPADVLHRVQTEIRSRYSVPPQVEIQISAPEASDVPGYDKLVVTFIHDAKRNSFDFLVSKDRKTLARLEKIDISQDLMSKINVKGRPVRGSTSGKVEIVNFDDFQCPFCARMHQTLFPYLLQTYGDKVTVVYKDYPLVEIHPWAMHAAIDANCLADQSGTAYWDFADYVHANAKAIAGGSQQEAFVNLDNAAGAQATKYHLDLSKAEACFKKQDESAVRASMAEGDKLGVDSTPTMFVNGEKVSGALSQEQLHAIVDRALTEAGGAGSAPTSAAKQPTDTKN